jgi:hypothetical protein
MPNITSTFWRSRDSIRAFAPFILVVFLAPSVFYVIVICSIENRFLESWERFWSVFRG